VQIFSILSLRLVKNKHWTFWSFNKVNISKHFGKIIWYRFFDPTYYFLLRNSKKLSIQLISSTNISILHINQYQGVMLHVRHKSTASKSKV